MLMRECMIMYVFVCIPAHVRTFCVDACMHIMYVRLFVCRVTCIALVVLLAPELLCH